MGLFSGSKQIAVASTVYNMAGEELDRPQYLDILLMQNIFAESKESIATTTMNGLLNGPSIRLRQFYKWTQKPGKYDDIGLPTGSVLSGTGLEPSQLAIHVPHPAGTEVWVQHALVGNADTSYWAEEYVMEHRPTEIDTAWIYDYDKATNKITIRFTDASTVVFTPTNFNAASNYVYVYYILVSNSGTPTAAYSSDYMWIYKMGSGNTALDAIAINGSDYGGFFPFIPLRFENHFLGLDYYPDAYKLAIKAYKKATGGNYQKLLDDLNDNPQLGDIDNAYVVFGVSLNVIEMACKRYLYAFFQRLQGSQQGGPDAYAAWKEVTDIEATTYDAWAAWKYGHDTGAPPAPEPPRPTMSQLGKNEIKITSSSTLPSQYDMRIQWSFISDGTGSGQGRPGAKLNDCWLVYMGEDTTLRNYYSQTTAPTPVPNDANYSKIRIYLQHRVKNTDGTYGAYFYTYLDIVGLQHKNFVYGGKSVDITAKEALEDPDESGFIIPLHLETWRATSLIDSSQMGTACIFIIFNSYVVKKQKWYETTIFRIFLVVVIAIVSVIFTGGAGIGLLGAHLSVGAALGFSGMTAAIVGSVVNALAAMLLATILEKVAGMFGIFGPVIAAILGIFIGNIASAFQAGGSLAIHWSSFLRVDNLLKLTNAVGGSVVKMMQGDIVKMQQEGMDYAKKSKEETKKIQDAYIEAFGYGAAPMDPFMLLDSTEDFAPGESPSTFLNRTLLTGTEIAEMSQDMIYNFHDYSLELPDAFV